MKGYKRVFNVYSAWDYTREIEDLNKMSEKGWQLVKGGLLSNLYQKNDDLRYSFQLDYNPKIKDMGRYIETFREQGWEYINSTFNGWHYFRKLYDPALPEEEYEIFTDRESLHEMNNRWVRIATAICVFLAVFTIYYAIRMIRRPQLPTLIQLATFLVEFVVLLRGCLIMRNPQSSRSRHGENAWLPIFFIVILAGAAASITLLSMRPVFTTSQQASSIDKPIVDARWGDFEVQYPDNYYLDLSFEGSTPFTFAILNEAGEPVFTETNTVFEEDTIRLRLPRGHYCLSMSCESGYHISCKLE